jgi:predicted RNA-binding Zn ribbon-like protein
VAAGRRPDTDATAGQDPLPVELANTVGWRFDPARRVERLPTGEALLTWTVGVGLLTPAEAGRLRRADPATLDAEAARVRHLREATFAALDAHAAGRTPPPAALAAVADAVTDATRHSRPAAELPLTWVVVTRDERVAGRRLALATAGLLTSPDLARVGRCDNEPCGWLFVDRTRNHTRRWCASTDCGNRERARRHYERTRRARSALSG